MTLIGLLRPAAGRLTIAALAGAGALGCSVALMATSAWLISRAAQQPPILTLMVAIVAVRAFGVGRGVLRYVERLVSHDAAFRELTEIRVDIYRRLERLAPAGLGRNGWRRGDLLDRLIADVDTLQDFPLRVVLPATSALLVGGATVGLQWTLLPTAGLITAAGLLAGGLLVPWYCCLLALHSEQTLAAARGRRSAATVELVGGAAELVAFGAAIDRLAELRRLDREVAAIERRAARTAGLGAAAGILVVGATVLGCAVAGISAVHSGHIGGVLLATLVLTPLAAAEVTAGLPDAAQRLVAVSRSAGRLREVSEKPLPVDEPERPQSAAATADLSAEHLSVRWPDQPRPTVEDITLRLRPGRRVAIVGPTGSGKSTLVAAILRFLTPCAGRVELGGIDCTQMTGDDVRHHFGVCDQDTYLFDNTIRANLLLAKPDATAEELSAALTKAGLDGWLAGLPAGVDTPVGEHGSRISGGERQRLALARLLLADRPLVLLDEPTAHLDPALAAGLTDDLLRATADRGTLLITHRADGLDRVDEILVLDGGRIVQRGTHHQLLADNGPYRTLFGAEPVTFSAPTAT